jgi:Ni/Fe-hydrogenase subunit HybB-like protein
MKKRGARAELAAAALRPVTSAGRGFWLVAGPLGLAVLAALAAWAWQIRQGLGAAGYSDGAFWSIYESNLVTFIGVSYGGAVVSAILRLTRTPWRAPITRLAEATALMALLVGMMFAVVHLGRPERIWELVVRPRLSSPIFWDFVAVSTYLVATAIFLYLPLIPDLSTLASRLPRDSRLARWYRRLALGWRGLPAQRRLLDGALAVMAVAIIPMAVSVHSVLAWAFALSGRPGWDSSIFAPYFVVAALYSGVALVILVVAGFRQGYRLQAFIGEDHLVHLGYLMLVLDGTYLYFTFADLLGEGFRMDDRIVPVLGQLLTGRYAPSFWIWAVGGGLLPLLLVALPWTRRVWGVVTASGLAVAGMWLKRMLIVTPVAAEPMVSGGWGAYHFTWVSVSVTIGAAAAIPLLLLVFFRVFPVLSVTEIEELAEEAAAPSAAAWAHGSLAQEGGDD